MKNQKTSKVAGIAKAELTPYVAGLALLHEMAIVAEEFSCDDIEHIGFCSIHRIEVVLCKVGNFWGVKGRMGEALSRYESTHHCRGRITAYFRINGRRVTSLRFRSKPQYAQSLIEMSAEQIFQAGMPDPRQRKHKVRTPLKDRLANAARMERL